MTNPTMRSYYVEPLILQIAAMPRIDPPSAPSFLPKKGSERWRQQFVI
jgi:hypothetical protein